MELVVIGINHKTAPVEIREKFSFSANKAVEASGLLKESASLKEGLILSTCNRVEIYAVGGRDRDCVFGIKEFLGKFHSMKISDYHDKLYIHRGKSAVEHLFRVASGLDSMVIGEVEILAQLKKAYQDARTASSTGKVLNRLLEKAFNTAKKIRSETFIGRGVVSVSSAAIKLSEKILGGLEDKTALIIGTGTVGEQLILYLRKNGIKNILVANRTLDKAKELAGRFGATAVAFELFKNTLVETDIVIASTGAPHAIIRKDDIAALMRLRKQRPLFIIDLAVPRDVEPGVNSVDNAYLYDIDDLQKIVDENIKLRHGELDNCYRIIAESSGRFMEWMAAEKITDEGEVFAGAPSQAKGIAG